MEDINWLEPIRFYALPLAERRKLLLAKQEKLQEQRMRLEQQRWDLKAHMARLALQQHVLENQLANLDEQQEEVFAARHD